MQKFQALDYDISKSTWLCKGLRKKQPTKQKTLI